MNNARKQRKIGKQRKNRMGKTKDLFTKKEISREHFMQEWGMIKDRNSKQKQKRIKKRW